MPTQLTTLAASIALGLTPPPRKATMSQDQAPTFGVIAQDALAAFQAAVVGIHAQFANTLVQAGHTVSEASSASELLNSAAAAANTIGKPQAANVAPNYADFALHAFMVSMEHAAVNFAAAHLPDKYKPVMGALTAEVQAAVTGQPVSEAQVVDAVLDAAGAAVDIAEPELAPIVTLAEPIIENEAVELLHAQPISEAVVPAAEPVALTESEQVAAGIPGAVEVMPVKADGYATSESAVEAPAAVVVADAPAAGASVASPFANHSA